MKYDYSNTIEYLLDWFDNNARILPWRSNPRPYYVWISEIMLQQTRVEAVKAYFERFIMALPTIKDLAEVEEDRLLKLWEGLGYYNRARNLQKAAKIVMEEYGGTLPADYNALLRLPGIGSYTAGAISSIAYGILEPAVDGNVLRVMKRIEGSFDDITNAKVKKELEEDLREVMPKDRSGDFNQSIMELGALICIPNGKPLCDKCPVMHLCKAFHSGTEMKIPVKPAKKPRKIENITVFLIEDQGRYLIRKRMGKGLLSGLWEFPNAQVNLLQEEVAPYLLDGSLKELQPHCDQVIEVSYLGVGKHIFTHIEWHMVGYKIKMNRNIIGEESAYTVNDMTWANKEEIQEIYSL
ncbi:MAG: A/G-specific adenine glycosylase, partial [Anaerocolumna sp.]|nr:A/G-specific adenine glycosylase [Anaerocolumna sp.]